MPRADYPQPWFDENGGLYPVYHAIKGLAALRGRPLIDLAISKPREIQAIAVERDRDIEIWLANLTDQTETVELKPKLVGSLVRLISIGVRASDPGFFGDGLVGTMHSQGRRSCCLRTRFRA